MYEDLKEKYNSDTDKMTLHCIIDFYNKMLKAEYSDEPYEFDEANYQCDRSMLDFDGGEYCYISNLVRFQRNMRDKNFYGAWYFLEDIWLKRHLSPTQGCIAYDIVRVVGDELCKLERE